MTKVYGPRGGTDFTLPDEVWEANTTSGLGASGRLLADVDSNGRLDDSVVTATLPYTVVYPSGDDDTTNIQDAETALGDGGELRFMPGTYTITDTISKAAGTVWTGLGNNARSGVTGVAIEWAFDDVAVQCDSPVLGARGQIRGIRMEWTGVGTPAAAVGIKYVGESGDPMVDQIIEDCRIVNAWRGVDAEWTKALYLDRAYIENAVEDGVHLVDSSDCWFIHSQTNGDNYGLYALRCDSLQIVDARPQVSALSNVYVEDTNFFKFSAGLSDSGVSAAAGTRYAVHLVDCDYFTIDAITAYSNGVDVEILIEANAADTSSGGVINGSMFHGFLGAIPIRVVSAGTVSNLSITGLATKNSTALASFELDGGTISDVTIVGCAGFTGVLGAQNVTDLEIAACPNMATIKKRGDDVLSLDPAFATTGTILGDAQARLHDVSGERISTPSATALNISGDLTVVARVDADDWTPSAVQTICSKLNSTGNQRSWEFQLSSSGNLLFVFSADGTSSTTTKTSTANLSAVGSPGTPLYVAVAVDTDNGAAGWDVWFSYSSDGSAWTQLGSTVTTAGAFPGIFASTAELAISGVALATARRFIGAALSFSLRSGFSGDETPGGTEVAAYNSAIPLPTYLDDNDNVWTLNGAVTFETA